MGKAALSAGSSVKFVDRIYTTYDSDVQLFKRFCEEKGFYYLNDRGITNGIDVKTRNIVCDLDKANFPYKHECETVQKAWQQHQAAASKISNKASARKLD